MSQDALAGYYQKKPEKCFKSEMLQKSRERYQNLPREEKKNQEHGREEYKNLPEDEKMLVEYRNKI